MLKNKFLRLATIAAGILLSAAAMAQAIKMEDVKVGATVTREGIDLGGVFSHDYLPVPEGEWVVLGMKEEQKPFGGVVGDVRFVRLVLGNQDANASIPLFWVKFNPQKKRIDYTFEPCEFPNTLLVNGFGSTDSQYLHRCAWVKRSPAVDRIYATISAKNQKVAYAQETMQAIVDNPERFPSKLSLVDASFSVTYRNRYLTRWFAYIKTDPSLTKAQFVKGNSYYDAVDQWVTAFGDATGKFVGGDRVVLPTFPIPQKADAVANSAVK
jgi:hypothetical protein